MSSTTASQAKVAVVTGANKDIGLSIVKLILMHHPNWIVYLTSRHVEKGLAAVEYLKREHKLTARYHQLDIESIDSIRAFKSFLVHTHPRGVDIFVHNAGIFPAVINDGRFDADNVRRTLQLNFFATLNLCVEMMPLMSIEARVVFVSSRISQIAFMNSQLSVQERIKNCFTVDEVAKLMKSFFKTDPDCYESEGWLANPLSLEVVPNCQLGDIYPFGISKLGLNLLARAYQNEFRSKNFRVLVNACCPGRIRSDLSPNSDMLPDQGADTAFYLTDLPRDSKHYGEFVAERKSLNLFTLASHELSFFKNMSP